MKLALKLPRRNPDAPRLSLRERYAALKGSAAKVIGKRPARFTPPKPAGAGKPSAALAALLAAHEMAYGYALYTEAYGLPDLAERRQAEEEAFRVLLHTPLHSDADRAAYAAAVISRQMHSLGDANVTGRDHPLAVAFRNISYGEHARGPEEVRHVGRPAEPQTAADPILAAIAASKAATAAFDAFEAELERYGKTSGWAAREAVICDTDMKAQKAVWQTVPTTPAGRCALVEFARTQVQRRTNPDGDVDDSAWLLGLILDAFAAMVADQSGSCPAKAPAAPPQAVADVEKNALLSAEQVDLSALGPRELSHLYEAFQVAKFGWEGVVSRPYNSDGGLSGIPDLEEGRASWIMDRIEREIGNRTARGKEDSDDILSIRVQHELRCNGRIHDNALLLDISRAWIV